jgi:hypothetical protein
MPACGRRSANKDKDICEADTSKSFSNLQHCHMVRDTEREPAVPSPFETCVWHSGA